LKKMMEFVARSHERCDEIEGAATMIAGLKEDYAGLRDRLIPLAAPENGIASRVKELSSGRDILAAEIDAVVQTPQGPLPERVKAFTDDRKTLEGRLAELSEQFAKLVTLREDFTGLFAGFDRALDKLATDGSGAGASDIDTRVEELGIFIKATQTQVDDIEERLAGLRALKGKLDVLQARLVPLESTDGGVVSLLGEIKDIRDKLTAKIRRMEASDEGGLAERVSALTETRRELEERVATLSDQVLKLATIRKDIAGLFEKLSSAASAN
jgi:chromosome segregation ATPase